MRGEDVDIALRKDSVGSLIEPILSFLRKHKEIDVTVKGVRCSHWSRHELITACSHGSSIHHEFFRISVSGRRIYSEGHHECSMRPIRKYLNLKRLFTHQDSLRGIVPGLAQCASAAQEDERRQEHSRRRLYGEYIDRQVDAAQIRNQPHR